MTPRRAELAPWQRLTLGASIAGGLAMRLAWDLIRTDSGGAGEASNVAFAIAEGRGFADAYRVGQGPTAHLLPITPSISGGVYGLLGVNAPPAEAILASWSIMLAMGTYLLLFRAFGRLGMSVPARLGAVAFACFAPTYIAQEAVDFRVWEGGLTAFLGALFLDRLLALGRETPSWREVAGLALLTALLFFVNPAFGLGAYACAGLFCLRHMPPRRIAGATLAAAGALALLVGPWAVRNARVMGAPIMLRSNAGLELALGMDPAALATPDPRGRFRDRLIELHPLQSYAAYDRMVAVGGEVAYSRGLSVETRRWIGAHPGAAARLALRHVSQLFAPRPWMFAVFGTGRFIGLRAVLATLVGVGGLVGLLAAMATRGGGWIYPALLVGGLAAALAPFQPVPRYTYLVYPLLLFCLFDLFDRLRPVIRARSPAG